MQFAKELNDLLEGMYKIAELKIALKFSEYNSPVGEISVTLHANPGMYTSTKVKAVQRLVQKMFEWSLDGSAVKFRDDIQRCPAPPHPNNSDITSEGFLTLLPHAYDNKSVGDTLIDTYASNVDLSQVTIVFLPSYPIMYTFSNQLGKCTAAGTTLTEVIK